MAMKSATFHQSKMNVAAEFFPANVVLKATPTALSRRGCSMDSS